ncbi:MAG: sulfotransferase family protein [Williamsia herbipolensis]|uniref:Sulfotransferase family protein n=1 Tax=Williamsia serinedens TaxID=391736 RepID=A0ABT1H835_9NOCA|nr:sulfotransferase family protein [Williamsia serinedens]MBE7160903.1 sulfotransferase family protein [Williamsia herbipolensis]MCP2162775.1 hypothetical protein [Williamsia serinedens]
MSRSVVVLHVGVPKTGTTYLQDRLWRNRDTALRTGGLLYPGDVVDDHFHAAVHLQPARYLDWVDPGHADAWPRLVDAVRGWPGTSVISHELFATAGDDVVERVLGDLAGLEVHVVVTARDLARQIPSVWQENVKNQHRSTLDEFVTGLRDLPRAEQDPFWEFQDVVGILRTWGRDLPPDRVHVVTVPRPGAQGATLWDRFCGLLGVDPDALDRPVPPSNTALSPTQTEMVRRLNEHLQPDRVPWDRYERAVKRHLIGDVLFEAPDRSARVLTREQASWAARCADEMVSDIREAGYDVVGDLDDLRVDPTAIRDGDTEPAPDDVLETTVATLAETLRRMPLPDDTPTVAGRVKSVLRNGHRRVTAVRRRVRPY